VKVTAGVRRFLVNLCLIVAAGDWLAPFAEAAEVVQLKVGANAAMEATLYKPAGAGPFPAVLVLHTSSGLRPPDHAYARRLADEGYVCLVPDFFTPYGLSQATRQQTFTTHAQAIYSDFAAAIDTLKKMQDVRADRIGAVGFSNGGYWALLLAAKGAVQVGVSYYGAVNGAGTDNSLTVFRNALTPNSAPVLVLHGALDDTVLPRHAEHLKSLLVEAKATHEFQMYGSAGHSYDRGKQPDAGATNDSWRRTLRLFDTTLKKSGN
jgi:carboxymethylenebutenolidase